MGRRLFLKLTGFVAAAGALPVQISWSNSDGARSPVAGFTSFEYFDKPWRMPEIRVNGGRLEALSVVPIDSA